MTEHTPGPWRAWPPSAAGGKWTIDAASKTPMAPDKRIATLHSGALHGASHAEANARLIASAPDLLALAKAMMQAIDTCEDQPICAWRGALVMHIAKAEGKS